jgi:hypothetical protein
MELVKDIRAIFCFIMLLGLIPYLWFRDSLTYKIAFTGFLLISVIWVCSIIIFPFPVKAGWIILLVGASCNQAAMLANGFRMPVDNTFTPHGVWRPMVETDKLKFLCDIYWGSASIGDLIALAGVILLFVLPFFGYSTSPNAK